jgi:hypothetical protein
VIRGPLLYSMPISHNYTVYAHHFGEGDEASNEYCPYPTTLTRPSTALNPTTLTRPSTTLTLTRLP